MYFVLAPKNRNKRPLCLAIAPGALIRDFTVNVIAIFTWFNACYPCIPTAYMHYIIRHNDPALHVEQVGRGLQVQTNSDITRCFMSMKLKVDVPWRARQGSPWVACCGFIFDQYMQWLCSMSLSSCT